MLANLTNRFADELAASVVQVVGGLIHSFVITLHAICIRRQHARARQIVMTVDGSALVAPQPGAVAREGNQIRGWDVVRMEG